MDELLSKSLGALSDGLASATSLLSSFSQYSQTYVAANEHHVTVPEFLQQLARIASQHEERQYVLGHLDLMHTSLPEEESKPGFVKDAIVKCVCCHLLGYDVSFICIYAIKLAQCGTLLDKKIGYLAASLLLSSDHELAILLVNTIQRDLRSVQPLEIACALTAAGSLLSVDTIPAVLPLVCDRLRHSNSYVRKKAVGCLRCFLITSHVLEEELRGPLKMALLDKDPAVMWSTLHVYGDLIQKTPGSYVDIVPSLVSILRQVIDGKLPQEFDHSNCPSPFLIVKLLKLLAYLGSGNPIASSKVYQLLVEIVERFQWQTSNAALAVASECCITACAIYPLDTLLALSSQYAGRLLSSCHGNTVYTGIKILAKLAFAQRLELVKPYQLTLVELLEENKDVNLRRQVLNLLYTIANPANVELVFSKLLEHVKKALASNVDLIDKMFTLLERFSPSASWFVSKLRVLLVECMLDEFTGTQFDHLLTRALATLDTTMRHDVVWLQEFLDELQQQLVTMRPSEDSNADCFAVAASWAISRLYTEGVTSTKGFKSPQQLSTTIVMRARCAASSTARLWLLCAAKLVMLHAVVATDTSCDEGLRCTVPSDWQIFLSVAEQQQLRELEMVQELSNRLRFVASKALPAVRNAKELVVDVSFLPILPDSTDMTDETATISSLSSGHLKSSLCYTTYADSPRQAKHESASAVHNKRPPAVVRKLWSRAGRQLPSGNELEVVDPDSLRKQQLAAELFASSQTTFAKPSAGPTGSSQAKP